MKELGIKGVIINTASVFGFLASPGTFAYHATKGAVIMMSKSARLNWHHMAFALLPLLLEQWIHRLSKAIKIPGCWIP